MESTLLERDNGTNSFTCLNQHLSIPKPALQIQGPNFQIMEPAFEAEDPEPTDSETRLSPLRYRFPNCEMLDVGRGSVVGRGVCVCVCVGGGFTGAKGSPTMQWKIWLNRGESFQGKEYASIG